MKVGETLSGKDLDIREAIMEHLVKNNPTLSTARYEYDPQFKSYNFVASIFIVTIYEDGDCYVYNRKQGCIQESNIGEPTFSPDQVIDLIESYCRIYGIHVKR